MDKRLQLYYWTGGNFGDDLNVWLWDQLIPDVVDTHEPYEGMGDRSLFLGIGTILADHLDGPHMKAVFGSGVGYHSLPQLDESWKIYCVRGPLTADELGLDRRCAITDPAALIRMVDLPDVAKKYKYSFMPHHTSIPSVDWESFCKSLGIEYIDPTADLKSSLYKILSSEVVIAEAMHAAIVADALRVPWIPVNLHGGCINTFKWNDWCESLGIKYKPYTLGLGENGRLIKRRLPIIPQQLVKRMINEPLVRRTFRTILHNSSPILSSDSILESSTSRLMGQMHKLSRDFESGVFGR